MHESLHPQVCEASQSASHPIVAHELAASAVVLEPTLPVVEDSPVVLSAVVLAGSVVATVLVSKQDGLTTKYWNAKEAFALATVTPSE